MSHRINSDVYKRFYSFIWRKCSDKEKYLMNNFAKEGLMNYKNPVEIYSLLKKGILVMRHKEKDMEFFSNSFRTYIVGYLNDLEVNCLHKKFKKNSTWQSFRIPFLLILLAITSFILFTQQDTWQRLMALIAGFSSTLRLLMSVFSGGSAKSSVSDS